MAVDEIQPITCFCKCAFIITQSYTVAYISSMAPSALQQQGSVVVTEILWPTKTKAFTIFGSLLEKKMLTFALEHIVLWGHSY